MVSGACAFMVISLQLDMIRTLKLGVTFLTGPVQKKPKTTLADFLEHRIHKTYVIVAPLFHNRIVLRIIFSSTSDDTYSAAMFAASTALLPTIAADNASTNDDRAGRGGDGGYTSTIHVDISCPFPTLLL